MPESKKCPACKSKKLLAKFSKNGFKKDGLSNQYKDCQAAYYQSHKEEAAAYRQTGAGKVTHRRNSARQRQRYPEKIKAHDAVSNAVRSGKIKRSVFCEECGLSVKTEGHHEDYGRLMEIDWFCKKCHTSIHKKVKNKL